MGEQSCCFSGYRPEKMALAGAVDAAIPDAIYLPLLTAVRRAHEAGCTRFISGMSRGFDLWAAQAVILLRHECSDVTLHCAVPYDGQEARWETHWRELHRAVLQRADSAVILAQRYAPECFHVRNRYMVDASARLICYYDGQPGGTAYTVRYAEKRGLVIENLADGQLSLWEQTRERL